MKILYFAPIYFDDMKQRPQQIAECLAKKHEVYYIEPTISLLRWLLKGGRSFRGRVRKKSRGLTVIRLHGGFTMHKSVDILDVCGVNSWSEMWQLRGLVKACDVVWVGYSGWYPLVRHYKNKPVIFDKMDEEDMLVSSKLWKMTLQRNKRRLPQTASAVIVTCQQFYDELKKENKRTYLVPNAVSDTFASGIGAQSICYEKLGQVKRFLYIGTISEWFDVSVIYKLLELDSRYEIYLAGRNYLPKISDARVHYLGVRKNGELPKILQKMDVCLYNFKQSPLLDTVNPVKIYEYLALNKPVLAVSSKETRKLSDYVALYDNVDEIGGILQKGLKRPFQDPKSLGHFMAENSWDARTRQVEKIIQQNLISHA